MATCNIAGVFDSLLEQAPMPAVAVSVFDRSTVLYSGVARAPLSAWWDLASLTKVLVTLPEALALLELDQPLAAQWPEASGHPVGAATVRQLLAHSARLPPTLPFFRTADSRASVVSQALSAPITTATEPQYSDIGYLLCGEMITYVSGFSLAELAVRRSGLRFAPLPGPAIPTEQCAWRGRLIVGEVHDENAFAMDGVAGHAGAFGTLDLVTAAAQTWFEHPRACEASNSDGERFSLGWWLHPARGLGGATGSESGFGHGGFVGNRIWFEPEYGYGVVILSNRIHPTRDADRAPFTEWCDTLLTAVATRFR